MLGICQPTPPSAISPILWASPKPSHPRPLPASPLMPRLPPPRIVTDSKMDIDGDGFLLLDEVYELLTELNEETRSIGTWDVLDQNAARDDLISMDEL